MNAEKILQSNLLDILFENRNKQYGAYVLRGQYNKQLYKALGFIFLITVLMLVLSQMKNKIVKAIDYVIPEHEQGIIPLPETPKPPLVPKTPAFQRINSLAAISSFSSNIHITRDSAEKISLPANLDSIAIGSTSSVGDGKKIVGQDSRPATTRGESIVTDAIDKEKPLASAEVMPEFPGGKNALQKFLERNLKSPADVEADKTVTVRITFIVGYDGILKRFEIVEDGGRLFNNEVIRVLKKMPQWIPGKSKGENVSVYYSIPVKFTATE